jgi:hypothetical protein
MVATSLSDRSVSWPTPQRSRKHSTSLPRQGVVVGTGWPNLLLRDKLPTGNEQGSAGMATVGSGAYAYEPVENWAKLPPGWSFKEIGGVGVDRHDNVFVFNRGEHPMIVFDCDGTTNQIKILLASELVTRSDRFNLALRELPRPDYAISPYPIMRFARKAPIAD